MKRNITIGGNTFNDVNGDITLIVGQEITVVAEDMKNGTEYAFTNDPVLTSVSQGNTAVIKASAPGECKLLFVKDGKTIEDSFKITVIEDIALNPSVELKNK